VKRGPSFSVSAGAALLFSLLFFFDGSGLISALLAAAAVHEAGHLLALRLAGARLTALRLDLLGFRMDTRGALSRGQELLAARSGPAAGLLFAALASLSGRWLHSAFLLCAAGVSLLLSLFNLLPALPLDGGQALLALSCSPRLLRVTGLLSAAALLAFGLYGAATGLGLAPLLPGLFLLFAHAAEDGGIRGFTF
jgi:Zn-dependent protease